MKAHSRAHRASLVRDRLLRPPAARRQPHGRPRLGRCAHAGLGGGGCCRKGGVSPWAKHASSGGAAVGLPTLRPGRALDRGVREGVSSVRGCYRCRPVAQRQVVVNRAAPVTCPSTGRRIRLTLRRRTRVLAQWPPPSVQDVTTERRRFPPPISRTGRFDFVSLGRIFSTARGGALAGTERSLSPRRLHFANSSGCVCVRN